MDALSAQIMVAVLVAYIVAAAIKTGGHRYVTSAAYDAAPAATFLWKKTFPLGFYAPAVLPLIVSSLVATFENVGAITSAMEVSQLPTSGPEHLTRIQVLIFPAHHSVQSVHLLRGPCP